MLCQRTEVTITIALKVHTTSTTGINSLSIIRAIIVKGEKVDTKHRTQFGSNELTVARFPVPKNDVNSSSIFNTKDGTISYH